MHWKSLLVAVLTGLALASSGISCGGNTPAASQQATADRGGGGGGGATLKGSVTEAAPSSAPTRSTASSPTNAPPRSGAVAEARLPVPVTAQEAQSARESDAMPPPQDAQWTLYCQSFNGPDHVDRARAVKAAMIRATGMREWYIVHGDAQSTLYYGYYRSVSDPADAAETARAKADHQRVEAIRAPTGDKLFARSLFVQLASPDPDAPPEWDLARVARKYTFDAADRPFWSIQIAAFKDHPDRKKAAVEMVRDARKVGEEAYFYHGETVSSVCIGAYPRDVVEYDLDKDARPQSKGQTISPEQPILVEDGTLPPITGPVRDREGRTVRTFTTRLNVVDPRVLAKMKQFPEHYVNGFTTVYKGGDGKQSVQPSFLVQIPHPGDGVVTDDGGGAVAGTVRGGPQVDPSAARQARARDPWGMTNSAADPYEQQNASQSASPAPGRNSSPPRQATPGRLRSLDEGR
jgi:hypothetical protein